MVEPSTLARNSLRAVTRAVTAAGEPERIDEAQADKNSKLKFLAVRVPALRAVVKHGFPFYEAPAATVRGVWSHIWMSSPYYEVMSGALFYYTEVDVAPAEILADAQRWARRVENWGHCDMLASLLSRLCLQDPHRVQPYLVRLSTSRNPWRRRLAVVSLVVGMRRAAFSLPMGAVWGILHAVADDEDRYVAKAVAWAIREAARADEADTARRLQHCQLGHSVASLTRTELLRVAPKLARSI